MSLMICENAGKCKAICTNKEPHKFSNTCCEYPCSVGDSGNGSKCIPYIPASEPIAPLTDHAKYCRLSKQAGGLCVCADIDEVGGESACRYRISNDAFRKSIVRATWEVCPTPSKQQAVELPKDSLQELIRLTMNSLADLIFVNKTEEQVLREFAEKVRAL